VEPKLRELTTGDIPQKELDEAFKAALSAFLASHKSNKYSKIKPTTPPVKNKKAEDKLDIDISDDEEIEEFIDFDES